MIRLEFIVFLLIAAPVLADPPQPAVVNAVADVYRPFPPDQSKLGGIIGARLRANSEGYIERVGNAANGGPEEQDGTLLDAAAYAYEYGRDPTINTVMVRLAKKLIGSQASGGYLGAQSDTEHWTEKDTSIEASDLLGLLNYYRVTGDPAALSASTKLGDLLVKERQKKSGEEAALFSVAIEPMVVLFRFTDANKYLQFCNSVAEAWLHAKTPELPATYKNLLILNGLVELYRINGDSSFFRAPLQAWTEMQASAFALTGIPAENSNPEALNACTTGAWLQLSANLLRISGQAVYGEQLERTVYNQLFAGQDAKTGTVLAPVSLSGIKAPANNGACAASEVRGVAQLPSLVWGRYGNGLAVNLYTDGRATVRLRRRGIIHLYTETNYPESGTVLLHVEPDHPIHFPLRLRVPDWTRKFTADVDADHFVGKPAEFLTLNRGWKRGDTVKISMVMTARTIPGIRQFSADVAVARGPQVLALGKTFNPDISDFDSVVLYPLDSAGLQLTPMATNYAANWMGDQAYTLDGTYQGRKKKLVLIPFADARNYRVWLAQSKASTGASAR
ncbi:MAG TPA: beta-L-arabinofuranosidase domain-containing protein [Bryobacteraceae bacterium]|nr:beta-L-arabinofuranosidase domain-containing protein [Bryobacteraceae bacterium]